MESTADSPPAGADRSRTLRALLARSEPRDFALRRAWVPLIRGLRAARRAGIAVSIDGRAALDRALDSVPRPLPDLEERARALKRVLRVLARDGTDAAAAARADAALSALLPRVASRPLRLRVRGWPPGFGARERRRLLGGDEDQLWPPRQAAALIRDLSGLAIAGRALSIRAELAPGEVLPAPPKRRGRRGRVTPWLEVDAVGRFSLTPRHIAEAQAALARGPVIDAFCGCGGNAAAFALAGLRVTAVELDPARLALARRNLRRLGLQDRVRLLGGDARALLPELLARQPRATVFMDPPWGGPGAPALDWDGLLPGWEAPGTRLLLKAPRAFDLSTLPGSHRWTARYAFGADGADDARIVKLLTLIGEPQAKESSGLSRCSGRSRV